MKDRTELEGNDVEGQVRAFYDDFGWNEKQGEKGEDSSFRMFRPAYYPYHEAVKERTALALAPYEGALLIVGCGDMPDDHVDIAMRFEHTTCLDISENALELARERIVSPAEMVHGSILDGKFKDNSFDAVFCAHVLYHIGAPLQEKAVREMLRVAKPSGKVVVIYSNPRSPLRYLCSVAKRANNLVAKAIGREKEHRAATGQERPELYFFAHPLTWWQRFHDSCRTTLIPWDVIGSFEERQLLLSDGLARAFYHWSGWFERRFPSAAVRFWQYPLIVLTKKPETS